MTTRAARTAVFDTVELLEAILVSLGSKTLYRIQRVSRHWQTVVATSTILGQKMFLQPRSSMPKEKRRTEVLVDDDIGGFRVIEQISDSSQIKGFTRLNPVFHRLYESLPFFRRFVKGFKHKLTWPGLLAIGLTCDSRYVQLVTNPPAREVQVRVSWCDHSGERGTEDFTIEHVEVVRLKDMIKQVLLAPLRQKEAEKLAAKSVKDVLKYWEARSGGPPKFVEVSCEFPHVVIDGIGDEVDE